jgi:hypothetical protein
MEVNLLTARREAINEGAIGLALNRLGSLQLLDELRGELRARHVDVD